MTTPDIDALVGNRMDEAAADDLLRSTGVGVLSLARDGEAYGVPISFGYDGGDRLYFVLVGFGEESRKAAFAADTVRASFATYDVVGRHDWRSVVVAGPLEPVAAADRERAREALGDNAWYPSLFSTADPMRDVALWSLRVEEKTGLRSESGSGSGSA
jgi:hypothetical protein